MDNLDENEDKGEHDDPNESTLDNVYHHHRPFFCFFGYQYLSRGFFNYKFVEQNGGYFMPFLLIGLSMHVLSGYIIIIGHTFILNDHFQTSMLFT